MLRYRVFLDTSALFSGLWSDAGGARFILKLGEAGLIQILASPEVLAEIEDVLRRKAPEILGELTLVLNRSGVEVIPSPCYDDVQNCELLIDHAADARVIASVWRAEVDFFVTLDRKHFLKNEALMESASFPLGTPGDFLAWFRNQ
ncbi:MAG: PIN domain-containing protein [Chloroflexota bacterium]|nr:PIN domain-containing protein [Chloroflexota bacterium]